MAAKEKNEERAPRRDSTSISVATLPLLDSAKKTVQGLRG
jgi:hypothetical protein